MYSIDAKWMGRYVVGVCCLMLLAACGGSKREAQKVSANAPPDSVAEISGALTHTEMRGMALRLLDGVTMRVAYLSGEARPEKPGQPVVLDDPRSYWLEINRAESRITYDDLARLLNDYVFSYKGAPIGGLHVEREHDEGEDVRLELKGHLKSLAGIPFEIEGIPEVTPDGRVRVRTKSIQSIGIKMGGLMHVLGIETKDIGDFKKARGIEVDGNDMILDTSRLLPPPRSSGRVTYVALEPEAMVMRFGDGHPVDAGIPQGNYITYRGGNIRLGRMTMTDADLQIIDADPNDPFDFYPAQMNKQISAGYVKVKEDGGLMIFAPDYAEMETDRVDLRPDR